MDHKICLSCSVYGTIMNFSKYYLRKMFKIRTVHSEKVFLILKKLYRYFFDYFSYKMFVLKINQDIKNKYDAR